MVLAASWFLAGCGKDTGADKQQAGPHPQAGQAVGQDDAKIHAALAQLSPEDRKLAEEQKYCAVMTDHRLGSMWAPLKVLVKDEPVFLCCKGCEKKALASPDKTLATAKELRARAAGAGAERGAKAGQRANLTVLRVPDKGIQPQVAVDGKGAVHLIYFRGDPGSGDIFYVRSEDAGDKFSRPIRVNSGPGSAIAVGNIRGAQLAVGKNGRVHVAWMGTDKATAKGPKGESPMLYTRLNDAGTAFEKERNVIQSAYGLDGGGSVAADEAGTVYVAWHAAEPGSEGEGSRCVWVARSTDEGKTFQRERRANTEPTGACGCCGMRAFADSKGVVYVLYRSAKEEVHRDMYLLTSADSGAHFLGEKVHDWEVKTCPASTAAFAEGAGSVLEAWETDGQVYFARTDRTSGKRSQPIAAPGDGKERKHPAVAANAKGETILVWTEGMSWDRGGSVAWQVFDPDGQPTQVRGRAEGVPTWSLVAVFARPEGDFTVVY
jgi:hypothetical protein